jgi:hypothetical protein
MKKMAREAAKNAKRKERFVLPSLSRLRVKSPPPSLDTLSPIC